MDTPLLHIKSLKTYFYTQEGIARAVDGMDMRIRPGKTLGVIGKSGRGKSVSALFVMRLIPQPPGRIIDVVTIFKAPLHPYTQALYDSIPRLTDTPKRRLEVIHGTVPNPLHFPSGCRFHPRCKYARNVCRTQEPPLENVAQGHQVRCFKFSAETKQLFS